MLANGIAAAVSRQISYGNIYTTKLLRRGIDIERPKPTSVLQRVSVGEAMQSLTELDGRATLASPATVALAADQQPWEQIVGPVTASGPPQILFVDEDLEQAMRQLVLYGHDGLPVLSHDGEQLRGWITRDDVLSRLTESAGAAADEIERGAEAADYGHVDPAESVHAPSVPLRGYQIVELTVLPDSPAAGRRVQEIDWPPNVIPVARGTGATLVAARGDEQLRPGERVIVLAPAETGATARPRRHRH